MIDRKELIEGLEYCIEAKGKNCPMACPFFKKCFSVFNSIEPFYPIMRAALDLLKEQEPKQVLSVADSVGEMEIGYCPSCRRGITNKIGDPTKFCRYCGQAVKWMEDKDATES